MFGSRGPGFRRLAQSHAGSVGGDTLVAMALAGTLFFSVPSSEARANVALYLLITLAPFAVIGPFLGSVFERFPTAYRGGLVFSAGLRAVLALVMMLWIDSFALFPMAFLLLVLSRFHGIARSSVLPSVLESRRDLIAGNAQLARVGVVASAAILPAGIASVTLGWPWVALVSAAAVYLWSAMSAFGLPKPIPRRGVRRSRTERRAIAAPRSVRLARFATAGVRFLNGFLLLLVTFAFHGAAGFLDFGALLGAGGGGYFVAAFAAPFFDRYISEEPMVVAGLAIEAGAAFIAAQVFGLPAAAALAGAAGFAWGTAKFGFDGLLQSTVPIESRGRAFTNAETFFQFAWVLGALIPVVPVMPIGFGLTAAGVAALLIQVVYVSAVLIPVVAQRRLTAEEEIADDTVQDPDRTLWDLM
ncbi:MAG: hypothetical protein PVI35_00435 [Acidimicrobiia bacterium]|jgi:hypothetical protein